MVDEWRAWVEARAGKDFADLDKTIADQAAFAKALRKMIADLSLGDEDSLEEMESEADAQGDQADSVSSDQRIRHQFLSAEACGTWAVPHSIGTGPQSNRYRRIAV